MNRLRYLAVGIAVLLVIILAVYLFKVILLPIIYPILSKVVVSEWIAAAIAFAKRLLFRMGRGKILTFLVVVAIPVVWRMKFRQKTASTAFLPSYSFSTSKFLFRLSSRFG